MSNLVRLLRGLREERVRCVAIDVWAVNFFAELGSELFATQDADLFLPLDSRNLLRAWSVCDELGLEILASGETLDRPRDEFLARAVIERRAMTRVRDREDLVVDLTLVMAGFEFDTVWAERRVFTADGVEVNVARLAHVVESPGQQAEGPALPREPS